jgi:hypothetical protein
MYVIIRRFRTMKEMDEVARHAMAGLAPVLKDAPGFIGYHVFREDRGGGGSITLFESREAAEAAHERALGWIRDNLADLYDGQPPDVTKGDVLGSMTA